MSETEAESYLVTAVRRGDPQAWNEIIARYQGRMVSFARRMLSERSEAEDIVQDTFLGLLRSLPTYDASRSLETYLFAILRNKLHDHVRRRQKGQRQSLDQIELDDGGEQLVHGDTPSHYVAGQEALSAQRGALVATLREWVQRSTDQRRFQDLTVIEMLLVLGMRNKEVAADLGMTEPAVAGIKFRVLEQWRAATKALGEAGWNEADLAADSTVGALWREEGISCLKRSTLGRYLLGVLDEDWTTYVDFHVRQADCDRCQANLADLQREDEADANAAEEFRARCFASSIGFLSQRPA